MIMMTTWITALSLSGVAKLSGLSPHNCNDETFDDCSGIDYERVFGIIIN